MIRHSSSQEPLQSRLGLGIAGGPLFLELPLIRPGFFTAGFLSAYGTLTISPQEEEHRGLAWFWHLVTTGSISPAANYVAARSRSTSNQRPSICSFSWYET